MNLISFLFLKDIKNLEGSCQLPWGRRLLCWGASVRSLLIHWNRNAEYIWSWWEEASWRVRGKVAEPGARGGKARWCEMKQTCQNHSNSRQARRVRSAPKSKATVFSRCLYAKRHQWLLERKGLGCTLLEGQRRKGRGCDVVHVLTDMTEHGLLLLPALWKWSLFSWRNPNLGPR